MRVDDHENDQGKNKYNRADDSEAVKVLLYDARAHLTGHRTLDHLADTSALTRVEHDESNKTNARDGEEDKHDNKQSVQCNSLLSNETFFQYASRKVYPNHSELASVQKALVKP